MSVNTREKRLILLMALFWRHRKYRNNCVTANRNNCVTATTKNKLKGRGKRMWVRPIYRKLCRDKFGVAAHLVPEMQLSDVLKYKNFFRMGPDAFEALLALVGPRLQKVDIRREPISPATRLGITLRYLAAGDSMASLSYVFRVGYSTVSTIIAETLDALWTVLKDEVLVPPDEAKWAVMTNGFKERWHFPNCIGAIDGKHVVMQAPPHSGSEFYNYKGTHSIILLAVVDAAYMFSIVDIGAQGRQSDGGVFRGSTFGQRLLNKSLNIPPPRHISNGRPQLPHVIVGDEAFPLTENLLRPYARNQGFDINQKIFNYRLSRARMLSENTFGILAARWRIYEKRIIAKITNIDNIVKATVCLHNFIMQRHRNNEYMPPYLIDREVGGNLVLGTWRQYPSQMRSLGRLGANNHSMTARQIREEFANYFVEEGAIPWQWTKI